MTLPTAAAVTTVRNFCDSCPAIEPPRDVPSRTPRGSAIGDSVRQPIRLSPCDSPIRLRLVQTQTAPDKWISSALKSTRFELAAHKTRQKGPRQGPAYRLPL